MTQLSKAVLAENASNIFNTVSETVVSTSVQTKSRQSICLSIRNLQFNLAHLNAWLTRETQSLNEQPSGIHYRVSVTSSLGDSVGYTQDHFYVFSFDRSDDVSVRGSCCMDRKIIFPCDDTDPPCEATVRPQDLKGTRHDPNNYVMLMSELIEDTPHGMVVTVDIAAASGTKYLGTAKLFINAHGATQGQQRAPILSSELVPFGELLVDYLIVQNALTIPTRDAAMSFTKPEWLTSKTLQMAHRGAGTGVRTDLPRNLLENTIASFNHSIEHGADFVELDLFVTRDGIPAVFHDFTVEIVGQDEHDITEIQCDELTLDELRALKALKMKQADGQHIIINVDELEPDNKPFQTLEEIFHGVLPGAGLCLEFKWPQMFEDGTMEAFKHRDINDYVDRVLDVVHKHANGRPVILQTFEANLALLLRMKQNEHPVIFLTEGVTPLYPAYQDPRTRNVINSICFARAFDFAGVNLLVDFYLNDPKGQLVKFIHNHDMVAHAWGNSLNSRGMIERLMSSGLDSMVYDYTDKILSTSLASAG
ncbi:Glycerophosphocholine phosphodiesterase GPCPD1 [Fragariocoptes setiger]|uniref:Glycerophosphocholine phosphodiesterase GPCPD1 n=1 Tax=Fragariocoptes setiger TaxID=1670756 RepID=A0ABQ7SCP9_9ACAR|nr:Glycerophosphocholine phosphodiesterase GPCPD1 [Fragariocoptes setiger]